MTDKLNLPKIINDIYNDISLENISKCSKESKNENVRLSKLDCLSILNSENQIEKGGYLSQTELDEKVNEWLEI